MTTTTERPMTMAQRQQAKIGRLRALREQRDAIYKARESLIGMHEQATGEAKEDLLNACYSAALVLKSIDRALDEILHGRA